MSRMGNKEEVISDIPHNERLEFLGDAVVEFTSRWVIYNIMSRMGNKEEVISDIPHNERLEFLGDAVVEFTSRWEIYCKLPEA